MLIHHSLNNNNSDHNNNNAFLQFCGNLFGTLFDDQKKNKTRNINKI